MYLNEVFAWKVPIFQIQKKERERESERERDEQDVQENIVMEMYVQK